MRKFAKLVAIASFALAACAASAQLIHEKPAGAEYTPEQGQDVVAAQQSQQGNFGSVGSTPTDTEDNFTSGPSSSESANSIVMSQATKDEVKAANEKAAAKGGRSTFMVLMVIGGVGMAATVIYMVVKK